MTMAVYNKTEEIKNIKEQIAKDFFIEGQNSSIIVKLYKNSETRESKTQDHDILKWLKENPEDISKTIKEDEKVKAEGKFKWEILKFCVSNSDLENLQQPGPLQGLVCDIKDRLEHKYKEIP